MLSTVELIDFNRKNIICSAEPMNKILSDLKGREKIDRFYPYFDEYLSQEFLSSRPRPWYHSMDIIIPTYLALLSSENRISLLEFLIDKFFLSIGDSND